MQALRQVGHIQVGRPGDSDQQVQQGEHLLAELTHLAAKFPAHQALACQKALLELKLCKPVDAEATVLPFTTEDEVPAARWAMHLAAHIYWLEGHLVSVHALAHLLSCWLQHRCHCSVHQIGKLCGLQRCASALHGPVVCSAFSSSSSCVADAGPLTTDYTCQSTARQSWQSYLVTCSSCGHHWFEQLGFKTAITGELMGGIAAGPGGIAVSAPDDRGRSPTDWCGLPGSSRGCCTAAKAAGPVTGVD